jgi:hypothetical protein
MTECGQRMGSIDVRDMFVQVEPVALPVVEDPEDTGGDAGAQAAPALPTAQAVAAPPTASPAGAGGNPDDGPSSSDDDEDE